MDSVWICNALWFGVGIVEISHAVTADVEVTQLGGVDLLDATTGTAQIHVRF